MLDYAIKHRTVHEEDIHQVVLALVRLYKESKLVEMEPFQYRRRFAEAISANLRELTAPAHGLPKDRVKNVFEAQLIFLDTESGLFDERVRAERIVEGHGDLRPEHICLEPAPVIIDCLEFNREFRIIDPADELAFLTLECERLGAPAVGRSIFDIYTRITGDAPPQKLVHFYESYRAGLRAKIAAWHTREPDVRDPWRWPNLARGYLKLAENHIG